MKGIHASPRRKAATTGRVGWGYWSACVPAEWRPLRIEGNATRGLMMLGDGERATMQIKWARQKLALRRISAWTEGRAKGTAMPVHEHAGFDAARCVSQGRDPDSSRVVWVGYSAPLQLAVEAIAPGNLPGRTREEFLKRVLPSIECRGAEDLERYSVFDSTFQAPEGFSLSRQSLRLGDLALEFCAPGRKRAVLRQVYPATLALERRSMVKWLADEAFSRRNPGKVDCAVAIEAGEDAVAAYRRRAFLPIAALVVQGIVTSRVAVKRDRLLIAECESPGGKCLPDLAGLLDVMEAGNEARP